MKTHLHSPLTLLILFICLSSCVSKRKYVQLQKNVSQNETQYASQRAMYLSLNDSLKNILASKDSLIDSLNYKLSGVIGKREKEKEKARIAANATKKSTLTKEQETEKKSLFIYNFTKHIEWPIEFNGMEFVIGVAGDDKTIKELETFMLDKKVTGKKIIVKKFKKGARYNLVYITSQEMNSFQIVKNAVRSSKTLLVTDDAILGSHITFLLDQDKVRYFVDKAAIEKSGLKVGQELMRYSG